MSMADDGDCTSPMHDILSVVVHKRRYIIDKPLPPGDSGLPREHSETSGNFQVSQLSKKC
jgi:hypothetical protein